MKTIGNKLLACLVLTLTAVPALAMAGTPAHSTVGAGGYDLVSYHTGEKPQRGNGNHAVVHDGVTYLFTGKASKRAFEAAPAKYLPAFGGYCAYGVAVGKKFVADPDVWEIVDGRLYLNLDNKIKGLWAKDISGHIREADSRWPGIKDRPPSEL